jgi:hypoxanthine phosphoribosyltransferase
VQGDLERVLFDERTILRRLDEIAAQISNDYRDRELTVIAVLNGSLVFMADLMRRIQLPLRLDCLSVASYHGKAETSGEVIFKQVAPPDVKDRHVLILDDILDSGHTLAAIREKLETAHPRSIRVCVLFKQKEAARARSRCRLSRFRDRGRIRGRLRTRLRRAISQFALHWSFAKGTDRAIQ